MARRPLKIDAPVFVTTLLHDVPLPLNQKAHRIAIHPSGEIYLQLFDGSWSERFKLSSRWRGYYRRLAVMQSASLRRNPA